MKNINMTIPSIINSPHLSLLHIFSIKEIHIQNKIQKMYYVVLYDYLMDFLTINMFFLNLINFLDFKVIYIFVIYSIPIYLVKIVET